MAEPIPQPPSRYDLAERLIKESLAMVTHQWLDARLSPSQHLNSMIPGTGLLSASWRGFASIDRWSASTATVDRMAQQLVVMTLPCPESSIRTHMLRCIRVAFHGTSRWAGADTLRRSQDPMLMPGNSACLLGPGVYTVPLGNHEMYLSGEGFNVAYVIENYARWTRGVPSGPVQVLILLQLISDPCLVAAGQKPDWESFNTCMSTTITNPIGADTLSSSVVLAQRDGSRICIMGTATFLPVRGVPIALANLRTAIANGAVDEPSRVGEPSLQAERADELKHLLMLPDILTAPHTEGPAHPRHGARIAQLATLLADCPAGVDACRRLDLSDYCDTRATLWMKELHRYWGALSPADRLYLAMREACHSSTGPSAFLLKAQLLANGTLLDRAMGIPGLDTEHVRQWGRPELGLSSGPVVKHRMIPLRGSQTQAPQAPAVAPAASVPAAPAVAQVAPMAPAAPAAPALMVLSALANQTQANQANQANQTQANQANQTQANQTQASKTSMASQASIIEAWNAEQALKAQRDRVRRAADQKAREYSAEQKMLHGVDMEPWAGAVTPVIQSMLEGSAEQRAKAVAAHLDIPSTLEALDPPQRQWCTEAIFYLLANTDGEALVALMAQLGTPMLRLTFSVLKSYPMPHQSVFFLGRALRTVHRACSEAPEDRRPELWQKFMFTIWQTCLRGADLGLAICSTSYNSNPQAGSLMDALLDGPHLLLPPMGVELTQEMLIAGIVTIEQAGTMSMRLQGRCQIGVMLTMARAAEPLVTALFGQREWHEGVSGDVVSAYISIVSMLTLFRESLSSTPCPRRSRVSTIGLEDKAGEIQAVCERLGHLVLRECSEVICYLLRSTKHLRTSLLVPEATTSPINLRAAGLAGVMCACQWGCVEDLQFDPSLGAVLSGTAPWTAVLQSISMASVDGMARATLVIRALIGAQKVPLPDMSAVLARVMKKAEGITITPSRDVCRLLLVTLLNGGVLTWGQGSSGPSNPTGFPVDQFRALVERNVGHFIQNGLDRSNEVRAAIVNLNGFMEVRTGGAPMPSLKRRRDE
jgi:hypothetical protein